MQVTVKLIGHLVDLVPAGGPLGARPLHARPLQLDDDTDLRGLMRTIGLREDLECFAMVNEEHVPAAVLPTRRLADGDDVVLLPPLKGG